MPPLIRFLLTRFATGFLIGTAAGLAIWQGGAWPEGPDASERYIAIGLFLYLFASTFGVGYLATALMLDDLQVD